MCLKSCKIHGLLPIIVSPPKGAKDHVFSINERFACAIMCDKCNVLYTLQAPVSSYSASSSALGPGLSLVVHRGAWGAAVVLGLRLVIRGRSWNEELLKNHA